MRKFKCRIHSILLRSQPWVEVDAYNAKMAAEEFDPKVPWQRIAVVDQEDGYPHIFLIDYEGKVHDMDMMSWSAP
jgi:hypothetical protein